MHTLERRRKDVQRQSWTRGCEGGADSITLNFLLELLDLVSKPRNIKLGVVHRNIKLGVVYLAPLLGARLNHRESSAQLLYCLCVLKSCDKEMIRSRCVTGSAQVGAPISSVDPGSHHLKSVAKVGGERGGSVRHLLLSCCKLLLE